MDMSAERRKRAVELIVKYDLGHMTETQYNYCKSTEGFSEVELIDLRQELRIAAYKTAFAFVLIVFGTVIFLLSLF